MNKKTRTNKESNCSKKLKQCVMPNFLNHPISIEYKKKFDQAVLEFIVTDGHSFDFGW